MMKRKVAMQKLKNPKHTEQNKMKKTRKKTKENRKIVSEEEGEKSTQKEMVDTEEIARKKAERQKKRAEQQKAKENKEREKAVKEKERAALMERDNRIFAEMNSLARNLNVESKRPCINLSDEEEYDVGRAEPMDDDEYFGGRDIISECSSYLHSPPNPHISALNQSPLSPPPPPKSAKPALQTPRATVRGKRPRDFTQSQSQLSPRPTVGGKKPRSMFHHSCQKCEEYKEIIATQDQEIAQLKPQGNYITFYMTSTHIFNKIENVGHFPVCFSFCFLLDRLIVGGKMDTS